MSTEKQELPTVAVVVPVFNERRYITRTLEHLLAQDYPRERYEVIVIDNGSTDGTLDAIQQFPVRLLHEEVKSSYAARNKGIRESSSEYVAMIDSDCAAEPGWLTSLIEADRYRGAGVVGGRVELSDPEKPTLGSFLFRTRYSGAARRHGIEKKGTAPTCNLLVRRCVFDKIGLFEPTISGGDFSFTFSASQNGHRTIFAEDALAWHPSDMETRAFTRRAFRIGHGLGCRRRREGGGVVVLLTSLARNAWSGRPFRPWIDPATRRAGIEEAWGKKLSLAKYLQILGYMAYVFAAGAVGQLWGYFDLPYGGDR